MLGGRGLESLGAGLAWKNNTAQPKKLMNWINTCMFNVRLTWFGTITWVQVRDGCGWYVPGH